MIHMVIAEACVTVTPVHLGFVVDIVMGQVSFLPKYFKFPSSASFLQHSQLIHLSGINSVRLDFRQS
jgi:hypothetical protein